MRCLNISMNVTLTVITPNGAKIDKNLLQTPTNVTYNILQSENPMDTYIKWAEGIVGDNDYLKEELTELKKLSRDSEIKLEWSMI